MRVCPNCGKTFRGKKIEVATTQGIRNCFLHKSCGTLIEDIKEDKGTENDK